MPESPRFTCLTPGCSGMPVRRGYCDACGVASTKDGRARINSFERGYDRRWRGLRAKYFSVNPKCEICRVVGKFEPAVEIHHKYPVAEFPELLLVWRNLQSLCKHHHHAATVEEARLRGTGHWDVVRASGEWKSVLPKLSMVKES